MFHEAAYSQPDQLRLLLLLKEVNNPEDEVFDLRNAMGASGVIDCIDDYLFDKPLILVGEDGANLVLRSAPIAFIATGKYWVNNHAHVLDAIEEICLRYLAVFFNAIDLKPYVTGTAQPKLNQAKMKGIVVPLPPLAEQHRIVSRVDELMGLLDRLEAARAAREVARVAHRESALAQLRDANTPEEVEIAWLRVSEGLRTLVSAPEDVASLRQTVLQLAVRGKLVPQDPSDEPARQLLERIAAEKARLVKEGKIKAPKPLPPLSKDELPFELPRGWEWVRTSAVFLSITDGDHLPPPQVDDGIAFLTIGNVNSGRINFAGCRQVDSEYYEKLDHSRRPTMGDILYTVVGTYGRSIVVDVERPFCVQRHIAILRPSTLTDVSFLHILMSSPIAYIQATAAKTGIAQPTVALRPLRNFFLPLPPLSEQHRIVSRVDELMGLLDGLEVQLKEARELQDAFAASAVVGLEG